MERVERIYSSYSGIYDYLFDALLSPGRRRAIDLMRIQPGDEILEVGVGTGLSLPYYYGGCRVTGIDISGPMLARAAARARRLDMANVDLRQMSAHHLKWPDGAFDKVLLSYVISTVEDPRRVIREVHRVCKPGGRVIFLSHFGSGNRLLAAAERRLTPLTKRFGFVLDLPLSVVTGSGLFHVESTRRVNLLRMWSLVSCTRA